MAQRIWFSVGALMVAVLSNNAFAQDTPVALTAAGKAILQAQLTSARKGAGQQQTIIPTCAFPRGLCGAVHRDGTTAIPPRYDWVGAFSENRATVRVGGLYGIVDETGREVIKPQYRILGDYKFGFAQVDVDGRSGLIDRDGNMVIAPTYGFIEAIAPDRFRVSDIRQIGGTPGAENFSGYQVIVPPSGGVSIGASGRTLAFADRTTVIDITGHIIETRLTDRLFDKNDSSLRWVRSDRLWGLAQADGRWLIEPKFQEAGPLLDGFARVVVDGKIGFIDRAGHFAIEPIFDKASPFQAGIGRTPAERDGIVGVIDETGSWIFRTNYQNIFVALTPGKDRNSLTSFGWHFQKDNLWGLLDPDGRVVLDANFDQTVQRCPNGRLGAYKNKEWLYFNADGSPLQPPEGRLVDAGCGSRPPYTLKIGEKFGLVDARSNPVTAVQFDAITWAGPDARNAKFEGKWGRIGLDGRWLLEPKFDYLSSRADHRAGGTDIIVASIDGKRGFLRPDGSWLIEPKFDAAELRDRETAFVTISGATGILRLQDQSWAIPPRPGVMCPIHNAIMLEADGKRSILSPTGETWIDIGAERVGVNLDLGLLTFLRDGKWGLVDTAGGITVEPQFDAPVYFNPLLRGVAWAKQGAKWCAIDRRGHTVPGMSCLDADPMPSPLGLFVCKVEH